MSIIVSNFQHCDEQQVQTLSYVHYTIFSVVKFIHVQSMLLDQIFAQEKTTLMPRVHLGFFKVHIFVKNEFKHRIFMSYNYQH